jgi:NAD(P)-dependent dehydrogenase (short-subunit alcohol dehydrogenase family)
MDLHRQIALVTGANRGLGAHLMNALLAADVTRVYAACGVPKLGYGR